MIVRPARLSDAAAIAALFLDLERSHAEALPDVLRLSEPPEPEPNAFAEAIGCENCFFAVAEMDGEVVGFVDTSLHSPRHPADVDRPWCGINNLAVRADLRRHGIGAALVRASEDWAQRKGLTQVRLNVFEFNAGARAFYESLGYGALSRQMLKRLGDPEE